MFGLLNKMMQTLIQVATDVREVKTSVANIELDTDSLRATAGGGIYVNCYSTKDYLNGCKLRVSDGIITKSTAVIYNSDSNLYEGNLTAPFTADNVTITITHDGFTQGTISSTINTLLTYSTIDLDSLIDNQVNWQQLIRSSELGPDAAFGSMSSGVISDIDTDGYLANALLTDLNYYGVTYDNNTRSYTFDKSMADLYLPFIIQYTYDGASDTSSGGRYEALQRVIDTVEDAEVKLYGESELSNDNLKSFYDGTSGVIENTTCMIHIIGCSYNDYFLSNSDFDDLIANCICILRALYDSEYEEVFNTKMNEIQELKTSIASSSLVETTLETDGGLEHVLGDGKYLITYVKPGQLSGYTSSMGTRHYIFVHDDWYDSAGYGNHVANLYDAKTQTISIIKDSNTIKTVDSVVTYGGHVEWTNVLGENFCSRRCSPSVSNEVPIFMYSDYVRVAAMGSSSVSDCGYTVILNTVYSSSYVKYIDLG